MGKRITLIEEELCLFGCIIMEEIDYLDCKALENLDFQLNAL